MVEAATELARRDPPFPSRIDRLSVDKLEAASAGFRERVLLQRFGRLGSDEAESQVRPLFERGERQQSNYRFLRPLAHSPASQPPMFTLYPPAFKTQPTRRVATPPFGGGRPKYDLQLLAWP